MNASGLVGKRKDIVRERERELKESRRFRLF